MGYGIVEFRTAEDAEQTWLKLRDEKIKDKDVVLTFCIPGKSAVAINNRIMWKFVSICFVCVNNINVFSQVSAKNEFLLFGGNYMTRLLMTCLILCCFFFKNVSFFFFCDMNTI